MSTIKIENIKKGFLGTVEFDLKCKGHRGFQNFSCYPYDGSVDWIQIQSEKRIGQYFFKTGKIELSKSSSVHPGFARFAYERALGQTITIELDKEQNALLVEFIKNSAPNGIKGFFEFDNSGIEII